MVLVLLFLMMDVCMKDIYKTISDKDKDYSSAVIVVGTMESI
jgi:hypothetical protein